MKRERPQKVQPKPGTGCRFIAGDPREFRAKGEAIYCNAPRVEGSNWCAVHHSLCWRPPLPRHAPAP